MDRVREDTWVIKKPPSLGATFLGRLGFDRTASFKQLRTMSVSAGQLVAAI